jgi:hypothetical protein
LKNLVLDYFRPVADDKKRRLWQSKLFWLANCFGPIGVFALNLLATDMNGDLPLLSFNASNVVRLMVCAVGIIINSVLAVFVGKYRVLASVVAILYATVGSYFWYAFVIRHGMALGFWIL